MEFNLFLWPMLIPIIIPLFYCVRYKRASLIDIGIIILTMILIVVLYWPLLTINSTFPYVYPAVKFFLFVFLPLILFMGIKRNTSQLHGKLYGITREGLTKSLFWFLLLLPIMIAITGIIHYYYDDVIWNANLLEGIISFFEAFSEEFFFRGILFIFLLQKTDIKIAYSTSLASFILIHPQNLTNLFILGTVVQGFITLEITRKSKNIIGSWMLHGSNRFFGLVILPLLL